jgi:amidophosphoribosyltransferase
MATRWELIASQRSVEDIRCHIGADSLAYQSIDGLLRAVGQARHTFCTACFTGDYPMPVQLQMDKLVFERRPVRAGEKPEPVPVAWTWEEDRH